MARTTFDPTAAVPDADVLEQETSVLGGTLTSTLPRPEGVRSGIAEADEADVLEQVAVLPDGEDDDYPHLRDLWLGRDV